MTTATVPATSISFSGVFAAETTICADAAGVGTGGVSARAGDEAPTEAKAGRRRGEEAFVSSRGNVN